MECLTIQGEALPVLGFGTWQITGDDCRRAVAEALAVGYRHIDTAQVYTNETEVGQGIRDSGVGRDEIFLTTKVNKDNFTADRIAKVVPESFKRLGVDVIDLMLMHWPSDEVPVGETLTALRPFQDSGRIRHLGVSNFSPDQVNEARQHATIFSNQVPYHPFHGQDQLVAQARTDDYLLTAYSPLARGKVQDNAVLREIAASHGKTAAQVTLRWLIQQDHVCAIPKAASKAHCASNFDIFDFELDDQEMARVAALKEGEEGV